MRALVIAAGLLAFALDAVAGPVPAAQPSVNLIKAAPTVVAVSSTVANRAILPSHLIDGDLGTAWNSRTGDLVGAWIGARVPVGAHVTAIRITVGFTKVDKTLGDLFTQNPRIRKVRVTRDGALVTEVTFDPEKRALQDIPIDGPGGEYKIVVVEIVPGTKKAWREISVSELEIWGTVASASASTSTSAGAPVVRVGSFDAAPITAADCVKALFPLARGDRISADADAEKITRTEVVALLPDLAVCRVDHAGAPIKDDPMAGTPVAGRIVTRTTTTVELAPVTRSPGLVAGERITATLTEEAGATDPSGKDASVTLARFPLTTSEDALRVDVTEHESGPMMDNGSTNTTLYRIDATKLTSVLEFKSTWIRGEASNEDQCDLHEPATLASTPQPLELVCERVEGRWHNEDDRGNGEFRTPRTIRYRWSGSRYRR
jgi:hypothetical protein